MNALADIVLLDYRTDEIVRNATSADVAHALVDVANLDDAGVAPSNLACAMLVYEDHYGNPRSAYLARLGTDANGNEIATALDGSEILALGAK